MTAKPPINLDTLVEKAVTSKIQSRQPLGGGTNVEIVRYGLDDGRQVVAKYDRSPQALLLIEAEMIRFLAEHTSLPLPTLIFAAPQLLITGFVPGASTLGPPEQMHAAELLADLHHISGTHFGLRNDEGQQFDTLIGSLPQPNPLYDEWVPFFRDQRLMYMAGEAALVGQLPMEMLLRLDKLAADLDRLLDCPVTPSLIHGDMWAGNIIAHKGRVAAFLDPAIYFADAEIELAFSTLFGTFNDSFFARYQEIRPLPPGFFEVRRDIYNLYPLLVHTRLFGGAYVQGIGRTLKRFGY